MRKVRNPDRYKEKECFHCGKPHKKRGKFCSRACSGKGRDNTNMGNNAEGIRNYNKSPEGIAHIAILNKTRTSIPPEDFAIQITAPDPVSEDYSDYERAEDW